MILISVWRCQRRVESKPCNVLSQRFFFFFFLFRRPWYHRALVNPSKAAVSNAYMDANGIGKVITISEAVFQALPKVTSNISCERLENLLGGCPCTRYGAYESLTCYLFCLTWSCVVTVQICYTLTHNLPFDRHAISWHTMPLRDFTSSCTVCHDVSCSTLRLTSSRRRSECHVLCYVVSQVFVTLFEDANLLRVFKNLNLIVNIPIRLRLEAI